MQPTEVNKSTSSLKPSGLFGNLNLKTKATLIAIAIGVLPITIIGTVSTFVVNQSLAVSVKDDAKARAKDLMGSLEDFLAERYGDIQVLANLPILRNERVKQVTTIQQRQKVLEDFAKTYGVYESITFMDLKGDDLLATGGAALTNHKDDDYFIAATTTGKPFISQPRFNKSANQVVVLISAPVKDSESGKIIGVVRVRMPVKFMDAIAIRRFENSTTTYHVIDKAGKVFLSNDIEAVANPEVEKHFPDFFKFREGNQAALTEFFEPLEKRDVLATFVPWTADNLPDIGWNVFTAVSEEDAFRVQTELDRILIIGSVLVAILTTLIAILLAGKATKPIAEAAATVNKIGKGELDSRITVTGNDELATLGNDINLMAQQLQELVALQAAETEIVEKARQEARRDADLATQEQRDQKEFLQKRAMELLIEVDPISRGDLTVRAKVTEDEIGTVADSYNSTVGSLRTIVAQVQTASQQVLSTTSSSEISIQSLSSEALRQALEITTALKEITEMSDSIRLVTSAAANAEAAVEEATATVKEGEAAMDLTVDEFTAIRNTVADTAKKVEQLGESSQKISQVVNLITSFAAQTNILALNASMEAARAGEEGRGFAVVADEVRSLARQSAKASSEIEKMISDIQAQTKALAISMQIGAKQAETGTQIVDTARQSLDKIAVVSSQINSLVGAISQASVTQTQTSESVTKTMNKVAAIADTTSDEAIQVVDGFKQLLILAKQLQSNVERFKVS